MKAKKIPPEYAKREERIKKNGEEEKNEIIIKVKEQKVEKGKRTGKPKKVINNKNKESKQNEIVFFWQD